jgi:hypothetical protein
MNLLFSIIPQITKALSEGRHARSVQLTFQLWYFALSRKIGGPRSDFIIPGVYQRHLEAIERVTYSQKYKSCIAYKDIFLV